MEKPKPENQTLSPCSSGRSSNDSNSPEFEFWMVRNPSFPQPHLLSADELFVDGILLPRHLLSHQSEPTKTSSENPGPEPEPGPGPESSAVVLPEPSSTVLSASKRWRDIFKKGGKKATTPATGNSVEDREKDKDKEKKKERKGSVGASAAELNINIWPFSRSRSAGNSGSRPKMAAGTRKVSSAPCSRSNSAGESKSRKWPSSPGRGGVHLGRSSPIWQVRRGGSGLRNTEPVVRNAEKGVKKERLVENRQAKTASNGTGTGTKVKALNLNVPMCIGYRHRLSCRTNENSAVGAPRRVGGGGGENGSPSSGVGAGNEGSGVNNLFNLRTFFSKKVF